jgi:hypothetical protein
MAVTLEQLIQGVRELMFDRFSTPVFSFSKVGSNYTATLTSTNLRVHNSSNVLVEEFLFSVYPKLKDLVDALIASNQGYAVTYNAYFSDGSLCQFLSPFSAKSLNDEVSLSKKYFFTDDEIKNTIKEYFVYYLDKPCDEIDTMNLSTDVAALKCPQPHHMSLWCAWWLTDKRRVYEMSAMYLQQSVQTGTGESTTMAYGNGGTRMTVQIGDVFSLEQDNTNQYNEGEAPWRVGSDNVLGDAQSFFYKLQLWLRKKIEDLFGDYSLRSSNVMQSQVRLYKETNFYAYFDNYPYTVSPYTRDILQGANSFSR